VGTGIDRLLQELGGAAGPIEELPNALVSALVPGEPDDDIAILLARVTDGSRQASSWVHEVVPDLGAMQGARQATASALRRWSVPEDVLDDAVLLTSELVTNAVLHGRAPISLRLHRTSSEAVLEVHDAASFLPRRLHPHPRTSTGAACSWLPALPTGGGFGPSVRGRLSGAPSRSAATSAATHSSKPSAIRREHAADPLSALGTRRNGRHRGLPRARCWVRLDRFPA
jgi:hypothetical protein